MSVLRISCVVPFCRRTRGQRKGDTIAIEDMEWICGDHWPLVDRRLKLLRNRIKRRRGVDTQRRDRMLAKCWRQMKRQAIERSAGL